MEKNELYEVIIVGGGPAGIVAGLYSNRAALRTVLVEKGLLGGQIAISKEVENYPGVEGITGFDLAEKLIHHAQAFGLQIIQEEVAEIQAGSELHSVRLGNGEVLRTVALILAVGGTARKLGVPGEAEYLGSGVSYCATCDGFFFRGKTVVVVGGGDTAAEEALYLSRLVRKVFLVHRRNSLRASKLLQRRLKDEPGIAFLLAGDGIARKPMEERARALGLTNVHFLPKVPLPTYNALVAESDISVVTLRRELASPVVPGKLQGIMAAGRPVLVSTHPVSDAKTIVEEARCGVFVEASQPEAMAKAIVDMWRNPDELRRMGERGREFAERYFDRKGCTAAYQRLFSNLLNLKEQA